MTKVSNPIIPGFNPDPAICRVGSDYYIATSTFEWYPGVSIYHSKDLANWTLVTRPLNRPDLLNMEGDPDSCGVWAPCLTHADDRFWLCYTDAKRFDGNFKDTHNYLTTSETIDGDWLPAVYMNSSGFDPSLFHDDDGHKWYINMIWDHRPERSFFGGIVMQEYSVERQRLIGEPEMIFDGTDLGGTEGSHIYKKNDWYYLIVAEGGTGYHHAVTIARSSSVHGPYEVDPTNPIVTATDKPNSLLQRTGHGGIVETPDGEIYLTHLCSRPLPDTRFSPMGRESALQKLVYTDDKWFRLEHGSNAPALEVEVPATEVIADDGLFADDFDGSQLNPDFQWLRTPYPEKLMSLKERPGYLRLNGRETLGSLFLSALVARRQMHWDYHAETVVEFEPASFQQMAGLTCYYNGHKHYYLYISHDGELGKYLGIMCSDGQITLGSEFPLNHAKVPVDDGAPIYLAVTVRLEALQFSWSLNGNDWSDIGPVLDTKLLSDEAGKGDGANFTGTFIGMCCQDLTGRQLAADFDYFRYQSI